MKLRDYEVRLLIRDRANKIFDEVDEHSSAEIRDEVARITELLDALKVIEDAKAAAGEA